MATCRFEGGLPVTDVHNAMEWTRELVVQCVRVGATVVCGPATGRVWTATGYWFDASDGRMIGTAVVRTVSSKSLGMLAWKRGSIGLCRHKYISVCGNFVVDGLCAR
jgi:hypothetical protein